MRDTQGRLPLSIALEREQICMNTVTYLVEQYPESVKVKNSLGQLPLYELVEQSRPNLMAIRYLVRKFPEAALQCVEKQRGIARTYSKNCLLRELLLALPELESDLLRDLNFYFRKIAIQISTTESKDSELTTCSQFSELSTSETVSNLVASLQICTSTPRSLVIQLSGGSSGGWQLDQFSDCDNVLQHSFNKYENQPPMNIFRRLYLTNFDIWKICVRFI